MTELSPTAVVAQVSVAEVIRHNEHDVAVLLLRRHSGAAGQRLRQESELEAGRHCRGGVLDRRRTRCCTEVR